MGVSRQKFRCQTFISYKSYLHKKAKEWEKVYRNRLGQMMAHFYFFCYLNIACHLLPSICLVLVKFSLTLLHKNILTYVGFLGSRVFVFIFSENVLCHFKIFLPYIIRKRTNVACVCVCNMSWLTSRRNCITETLLCPAKHTWIRTLPCRDLG